MWRSNRPQFWHTFFKKSYDLRGKQQRFADFNSKFVAVRGKKSDLEGNGVGIGDDHEQALVHPWLYLWGEKRAPNGFLGMRGKRPGTYSQIHLTKMYLVKKLLYFKLKVATYY